MIKKKKYRKLKMRLCQCGCGQACYNRFVKGHANKGKKFSKLHKDRIAISHKKRSKETSRRVKAQWEDDNYRSRICKSMSIYAQNRSNHHKFNLQKSISTEECKNKQSIEAKRRWKDPDYRNRVSLGVSQSVKKNWDDNPDRKIKTSRRMKELWADPDSIYNSDWFHNMNSKKVTNLYIEGKLCKVGKGKSGYFFSKKNNKKLWYRSSYELIAYELLEQLSKVKSYEVEPFSIQYEWKNSIHRTIPDILVTYIDNSKELIEVKPRFKFDIKKEQIKLNAMKEYAENQDWSFSIWSEKELDAG